MLTLCTRCDQKVCGKKLPFLHHLIKSAGITAHTTATYMQLIGYNMLDVSRLQMYVRTTVLKATLYSANRHVLRCIWTFHHTTNYTSTFFVNLCYAVIAHIAFHAYLTTHLLLFYANFQRFISNGGCSKSKRITVLSKGKAFYLYELIACLACQFLKKLFTHFEKHPFRTGDLLLELSGFAARKRKGKTTPY